MRQRNAKLFRYMFHNRRAYRRFKKAYTHAPIEKRLATIAMAQKIRATGPVKDIEGPDVG
jgi:hypothetical protein